MDSKRFSQKQWQKRFQDTLTAKLKQIDPYDIVITADDNALRFVEAHKQKMFGDIPVIFFGVNNQPLAYKLGSRANYTGVIEATSQEATLKMIWQMLSDKGTINVIVDSTPSGQADIRSLETLIQSYPRKKIKTHSLADKTWEELGHTLDKLPYKDSILLLSAYQDRNMSKMRFDESLAFINDHARVPIFHLWEHGLGDGVLGGKMVSHYEQGRIAGLIALDILKGRATSTIPIMSGEDANRYMVDHTELTRLGIPEDRLPEDTILVNKPVTLYGKYEREIILASVAGVTLAILTCTLFAIVVRLRLSQTAMKETVAKLRVLIEESPFGMILFDENGVIEDCNDNFIELMGSTRDRLIGFNTATDAPKKMRDAIAHSLLGNKSHYEGLYTSATGNKTTFLRVLFNPVVQDGKVLQVIATLEDITREMRGKMAQNNCQ